jgi:hypothetical protein
MVRHPLIYTLAPLLIATVAGILLAGCMREDVLAPISDVASHSMPVAVGNVWIYQWRPSPEVKAIGSLPDTVSIAGDTLIDGIRWYRRGSDFFYQNDSGFYTTRLLADGSHGSYRYLTMNPSIGDTIYSALEFTDPELSDSSRATREVRVVSAIDVMVTVPAGRFRCNCVTTYRNSLAVELPWDLALYANHLIHDYYASGIGRIKSESWHWATGREANHEYDYVEELTSFHLK